MICGNCGAENTEGAIFCTVCGRALRHSMAGVRTSDGRPRRRGRFNWDILLCAGAVLAAALLVFAVWRFASAFSQRSSDGEKGAISGESAVRTYLEASVNGDGALAASVLPGPVVETICEDGGFSENGFSGALTELFQSELAGLSEDFPGWTWSMSVIGVDDIPDSDLKHLKAGYETDYGLSIEGAVRVEIELSISCEKGDKSWQDELSAVRTDDGWFVDIYSLT